MTDSQLTALLEIIELAYADDDREDAWNLFFAALRKVVPFSNGLLMPVDPDTWQLQAGWCCPSAPEHVAQYLDHYCQYDPLIAQGPIGWRMNRVVHCSDVGSCSGKPADEFLAFAAGIPFKRALSVLCGYRGHPTALFRLCRKGRQRDFSPREVAVIAGVAAHIGRCVHLRQLAERPDLALPRGLLVIGPDERLLFQSEGCKRLVRDDRSAMRSLLASVRSERLWFSAELGMGYRAKPVPFDRGSLLACFDSASKVAALTAQPARARAFLLEPIVQRSDLRKRLLGHGLTARELEIGLLVLQGLPYKAIANSLDIAEQTVKDHLRNVFKKVGVRSGGALVAQIVGVRHLRYMGPG